MTLTLLGLCAAATIASAATPQSVLTMMCAAEGGSRWQHVAAISGTGAIRSDGMDGQIHSLVDLRDGLRRNREKFPAYTDAGGIDAHGAWRQDRSGQVHSLNSREADTLTVTDRWLARRGYCALQELPATLKALAPTTERGVNYDRVDATPPRGRTVTLWIDSSSHLLARTVMLRSFQTVTTRFANYRKVDGLELPFRMASDVGNPANADVTTIRQYRLLDTLQPDALKRPGDAVTDAHIRGGASRAAIPFRLGNTKLLVEAKINGKGPFPFILDTGGHAILTPQTAARIGLKSAGAGRSFGAGSGSTALSYARVDKLQLGGAEIDNQSFLVLPLPPVVTDLGDGAPIAGVLGLEVFERFAVTLDFDKQQMVLQPFDKFTAPVGARKVPIRFTDDMPLIKAELDGRRGIFGVDTGNSGPLMVFPQWARREGLAAYYLKGVPAENGGQGGMFTTHSAWIRSLRIGGLDVPTDQPGELTPPNAGSTSNPSEAGNLGLPVWRHFDASFDYRQGTMYLMPRPHFTLPSSTASAGFIAVKLDHAAFTVVRLKANGIAANAGLKKGDKIVSVDATPAVRLAALWLVEHVKHAKPGTPLHLVFADGRKLNLKLVPDTANQKALRPSVH
ncbi:MAG TPA: aspartyl protease family protein [Rhodanobacteraceae bacterium]|nr:aspartyl protease family protein [Rhodanobacteraceae bacterium]